MMFCAYCKKEITEEEVKNGTFIWIREFKYGNEKEMKFVGGGLALVAHKRCFTPLSAREHPCEEGLVE